MIDVTISEGRITVKGHAGFAPIGQDIVCAAVSTLVQTFLWSIDGMTDDVINSVAESGNAVIKYENLSERGKLLKDSFLLGICLIAEDYPENIRVTKL